MASPSPCREPLARPFVLVLCWGGVARWRVEAVAAVVVRHSLQDPSLSPACHGRFPDPRCLRDLFAGQHTCLPKPRIAVLEPVAADEAPDDRLVEGLAFPGARALGVDDPGDLGGGVMIEESVDLGQNGCRGEAALGNRQRSG